MGEDAGGEAAKLREELGRLRRSMARQLTETGSMVMATRELDTLLYRARHFGEEESEEDFFADLARANAFLDEFVGDLAEIEEWAAAFDIYKQTGRLPKTGGGRSDTSISREEEQLALLRDEYDALERKLVEQRRKLNDAAVAAAEGERRLEMQRQDYERRLANAEEKLSERNGFVRKAKRAIEVERQKRFSADKQIEVLRTEKVKAEDDLAAARRTIDEHRDRLATVVEKANERINAIEAERDALRAELQSSGEGPTPEEREELVAERDRLARERDELAKHCDELAGERDALASERDEAAARQEDLEARIRDRDRSGGDERDELLSELDRERALRREVEEDRRRRHEGVRDLLVEAREAVADAIRRRNEVEHAAREVIADLQARLADRARD